MSGPEAPTDEQLYYQNARPVARMLAATHIKQSQGLLEYLDFDPTSDVFLPGQHPNDTYVEGFGASREAVDEIAIKVEPYFDDLKDAVHSQKDTAATADAAAEHLSNGGNIGIVTPHSDIKDIAFAFKIFDDLMAERGIEADSAILVSKMIMELGYNDDGNIVPAVFVLQTIFKHSHLSWPITDSSSGALSQLPYSQVRLHNDKTSAEINRQLALGGVELAVAPKGTTRASDKSKIRNGTVEMLTPSNMMLIGMMLQLSRGGAIPKARLYKGLVNVDNRQQLEGFVGELDVMNEEMKTTK